MLGDLFLPVGALIATTFWLAIRHAVVVAQKERQLRIARRGSPGRARVVAIQRPFMLDASTRLYFDFVPEGSAEPLRACHIDRRPPDELRASLPAAGSVVTIRYLPEQPTQAVIPKLLVANC